MCIIAVKPANKEISIETFKNCFENNPDGCGFMYPHKGKVIGKKGIMTFKDFEKEITNIPSGVPVVYHFRISTCGGVVPKLTHPFPLNSSYSEMNKLNWCSDFGVAHNGVFTKITPPEGESDTEAFIANILMPLKKLSNYESIPLTDKYFQDIIDNAVGSSRLAIMDSSGKITMYGDGWTHDDNGCYYSNSTYSYSRFSSYCTNYDSDYKPHHWWDEYGKYNSHNYNNIKKMNEEKSYRAKVKVNYMEDKTTLATPSAFDKNDILFFDKNGTIYTWSDVYGFYNTGYECFANYDTKQEFILDVWNGEKEDKKKEAK